MDLLRSSIKVLFHDFSLEAVVSYLSKGYIRDDGQFKEYYIELMKWRESTFTTSEIRILYDWLKDDLLSSQTSDTFWNQFSLYERVFHSLQKCGDKLLRIIGNQPKVAFENLLRWRDLTLMTGEDLITLPTLAKSDIESRYIRKDFCWPNVLGHDNLKVNDILKRVLSDTHAHLWASADVFEINWLIAMNHPEIMDITLNGKSDFLESGMHMYYDKVNRFTEINKSLREWIIIAAVLRMKIFQFLYHDAQVAELMEMEPLESLLFIPKTLKEFQGFYGGLTGTIEETHNGVEFDYAIKKGLIYANTEENLNSPFMMLSGERRLLYDFFCLYFGNNKDAILFSPVVYLYLLIKNKIRREIVQTNELVGFENFQSYQNLKLNFIKRLDKVNHLLGFKHKDLLLKFAFQSSILGTTNNNFEARISPTDLKSISTFDYHKSIYGEGDAIKRDDKTNVSLIVHFIKKPHKPDDKSNEDLRHSELRKELKRQLDKWEYEYSDDNPIQAIGFDAAGSELDTPPEVFAPTFKELRNRGHANFTFHAGEDFYDLIHGLRSIDEAVEFLNLSSGCRIGHALALGVDAGKYYESRHFNGIVPKQILLDNLIWFKYAAMEGNVLLSPRTEFLIEKEFTALANELGYDSLGFPLTMYDYWTSMKNRKSDPLDKDNDRTTSKQVEALLQHYWRSPLTTKVGNKTHTIEFPREIQEEISQIQNSMMHKIEERGIVIETNPSSNVKIGPFSRYSDLPLFKMHPIGTERGIRLPVTINTDDKGVFATSLENEYSLVALSLRKMKDSEGNRKWNDKEIEDYLKQLAEYSNMTRFQ
ncbi:MAG: hypothetical protein NC453_12890 [Muribaculum sp.]|nr:hypothetical protein [Muribaculum sp.]